MIRYESRGSVLVAGEATRALPAARAIAAAGLRVFALVTGDAGTASAKRLTVAPGRIAAISGHLGQFSVKAAGPGDRTIDLGPQSRNPDDRFDLVLDLSMPPLFAHEVKPLGYFAPGNDPAALEAALVEIPKWVGQHEKPRFFDYEPGLCSHGAQGLTGCTRCLTVCPAGAIRSGGDRIMVDPYLCRGCATCAVVCPSGAIRYDRPPPGRTLERLHRLLLSIESGCDLAPCLMVREPIPQESDPIGIDGRIKVFEVAVLASFGMEFWFFALAGGVHQVLLPLSSGTPRSTVDALAREVALARRLLAGLGHDPRRIALIPDAVTETVRQALLPQMGPRPAVLPATAASGKRALLFEAIDRLAGSSHVSIDAVPLPPGSPFGSLEVDRQACTLCLACAHLCPTSALRGQDDTLRFVEGDCVQCGLCAAGCPEKAIRLAPRFAVSRRSREEARPLAQAQMFRCIRCGTPFAPVALVQKSKALLAGHPTMAGEGARLLEMCPNCRVSGATVSTTTT